MFYTQDYNNYMKIEKVETDSRTILNSNYNKL